MATHESTLDFPNVRSEADFVRAYVHALTALRRDVAAYVGAHGFEKSKYDAVFSARLGDLYMGLTDQMLKERITQQTMEALALLYHKEIRELGAGIGQPFDDYSFVAAEFEKVRGVIDRALNA